MLGILLYLCRGVWLWASCESLQTVREVVLNWNWRHMHANDHAPCTWALYNMVSSMDSSRLFFWHWSSTSDQEVNFGILAA